MHDGSGNLDGLKKDTWKNKIKTLPLMWSICYNWLLDWSKTSTFDSSSATISSKDRTSNPAPLYDTEPKTWDNKIKLSHNIIIKIKNIISLKLKI